MVFDDFKGSGYQLPQHLKPLDGYLYVIDSRGLHEIEGGYVKYIAGELESFQTFQKLFCS